MSLWDVLATHKINDDVRTSSSLRQRCYTASLPVTPAFVDARRRKKKNDLTTKGVFPHVYASAATMETVNNNNNNGVQAANRSDIAQKDEDGDIIVSNCWVFIFVL